MAIGPTWATGSWTDTSWLTGSWEGEVTPPVGGDGKQGARRPQTYIVHRRMIILFLIAGVLGGMV